MKIDIWSDIACPWCYVGKRRLEQALAGMDVEPEITWHSFELNPASPPAVEGDYDALLATKYGMPRERARQMIDHMTQTGAAEGIEFDFGRVRPGNTFDGHRLIKLAYAHGAGGAMKERLLRAYLSEGALMSDADTLVRLAEDVGLEGDEVRAMLEGDRFSEDVRGDELMARHLGISGVPFFVVDSRYGISGAQPAETLRQILEGARAKAAEAEACDETGCAV